MADNSELITQMLESHPRNYTIFKEYFIFGDGKDAKINENGDTYPEVVEYYVDDWFQARRREYKHYYYPSSSEIYDKFLIFADYLLEENCNLMVPVGIGQEFTMTYQIVCGAFDNLESLLFLIQCYFEGVSLHLLIQFKFHYDKTNYQSYSQILYVSGPYACRARKKLTKRYNELKEEYIARLYCTASRDFNVDDKNVVPSFNQLQIEIKCRTPEESCEPGG